MPFELAKPVIQIHRIARRIDLHLPATGVMDVIDANEFAQGEAK
jgi:hypothetical protein